MNINGKNVFFKYQHSLIAIFILSNHRTSLIKKVLLRNSGSQKIKIRIQDDSPKRVGTSFCQTQDFCLNEKED